jgi:hypothetical protein
MGMGVTIVEKLHTYNSGLTWSVSLQKAATESNATVNLEAVSSVHIWQNSVCCLERKERTVQWRSVKQ